MRNLTRIASLVRLGVRRGLSRVTGSARLALSVAGVAIAIGLLITVTGIGLGLATQTTIYGQGVDYWIVPESSSASAMAVSVGGPQFGAVHPTATRISDFEGVTYATPVSMKVMSLRSGATREYVLIVGVVVREDLAIAGLNTNSLAAGDPHYANGQYTGPWTGGMVVSAATAKLLGVDVGDRVTVGTNAAIAPNDSTANQSFTVVNVSDANTESGIGSVPVAVVHLSELQTLTGSTQADTADQFLVTTNAAGVKSKLESVYPRSVVVSRSGLSTGTLAQSNLALAVSITAVIVALIVGTLFVATTAGMEITADRSQYATLAAIGISRRSQAILIGTQTITITLLGGISGLCVGIAGIALTNKLATTYVTNRPVALMHPALFPYGVLMATLVGLLATPYLVWLTSRTNPLDHLHE